jgi:hypothetical protein
LAEAFDDAPEVSTIPSVALVEMVAEKFVALTRGQALNSLAIAPA